MGRRSGDGSESRFAAYVKGLSTVIGHADRAGPLRDYCMGLMMPGERKSVEPMAAVTAPARTAAQHQSLLHFVGQSAWSDTEVWPRWARWCCRRSGIMEQSGVDHRRHWFSQEGGTRSGWRGNIAASSARRKLSDRRVASLANHHASLPVAISCTCQKNGATIANVCARRAFPRMSASRPSPRSHLSNPQPGAAGLPRGVVLMDAAYGNNSDLRSDITALGLTYAAGILSNTTVWAPGTAPLPAKAWSGRGRPPKRLRRDAEHLPISVKELAFGLPNRAWRTIAWRQGSAELLSSRFARVRVHAARRDFTRSQSRPEEWLLIEWPKGELEPTKYWLDPSRRYHLSTPGRTRQTALADRARLSGAQARGRARAFRRPRMARLSSSRHAVHRRLRIPGLREGDDSPLRLSSRQAVQDTCRSQRLPTQRLRRCEPNDTFRTRLRQSDNA